MLFEIFKALLAGATAAGVFVFGQAIQRFIFEPVVEMRKLIGRIAEDLHFYANRFSSPSSVPDDQWKEATDVYRKNASELRGAILIIPFYDYLFRLFFLPKRKDVIAAARSLIGLSNMSRNPDSNEFQWKRDQFDIVHRALNIPTEKEERTGRCS